MKKYIIALVTLGCAASVFAQGTVFFNTASSGNGINIRVYAPEPGSETIAKFGNTATQTPAGTQTYGGALLSGTGWTASLWAATGFNALESSLQAASPTTTFRTGAGAGAVANVTATLAGVAADAPQATLQMRVYPASYPTWAAAEAAWLADTTGTIWIGKSQLLNLAAIGGNLNTPPYMAGMTSFSLVANIVPEPSSFALLGLGALGMLIFRRK
jgi:Ca2+-binding RTX toxin-like protein